MGEAGPGPGLSGSGRSSGPGWESGNGVRGSPAAERAGRRVRRGGTCARGGGEATGATAARAGRAGAGRERRTWAAGPLSAQPGPTCAARPTSSEGHRAGPAGDVVVVVGEEGSARRAAGAADWLTSACFRTTLSGLSRFPRSR